MTISLYTASVPVFRQMLNSLSDVLRKAEAHATDKKIEPAVLLQARLYPDMFPLLRQVQIATEFARSVTARLAGEAVAPSDDTEQSFAELQKRIATTIELIDAWSPAQIDGNEAREILLRPGTPKEKKLNGQAYLLQYGFPQFFFHVTTAYAILRNNGVELGKRDYMGVY